VPLIRRFVPLALLLVALVAPLAAQAPWLAGRPADFSAQESFRLRNLVTGGSSGEELYAALQRDLGTTTRATWNGAWALGTAPTASVSFTLSWDQASSSLMLGLGSQLGGVSAIATTPGIAAAYTGSAFRYTVASPFTIVRFFGRADGSAITALTLTDALGATTLVDAGDARALSAGEQLLALDGSRDWTLSGTITTPTCGGEGCRIEIGVATVPEPATIVLVGAGLTLLGIVCWRRHRPPADAPARAAAPRR
jgi:hypothetical protein